MKFKVTQKEMKKEKPMIAVLGSGLDWLISYESPVCYSASNTYGWRCDYYKVEGSNGRTLWISTGYAPIGDRVKYEMTKRYNDKAREIACADINYSYEEKKNQIDSLLKKFVDEVLKDER